MDRYKCDLDYCLKTLQDVFSLKGDLVEREPNVGGNGSDDYGIYAGHFPVPKIADR